MMFNVFWRAGAPTLRALRALTARRRNADDPAGLSEQGAVEQ